MKRMTRQRLAILNCFSGMSRPLSVDEIAAIVAKEIPEINLSTVYRNLKNLIQLGKIIPVEIPGGKVCYEAILHTHHHHFYCDECDRLFNIPGCPEGLSLLVPEGFQLLGHSITLNGICIDCQKKI